MHEAPLGMTVAMALLAVLSLASAAIIHPAVKQRLIDPAAKVLTAQGAEASEVGVPAAALTEAADRRE